MIRCAKGLGLKARSVRTDWSRLEHTPLPAIAALRDGSFLLLGRRGDDQILVQVPDAPRPAMMSRGELEAAWDGQLVLMTKRAALTDLARRFDITWFMGAIHKYRWLLGEVLIASFFLQLFALVSPLFFQVVIDKVLVHRSMSTLDVLAIELVAIAMLEISTSDSSAPTCSRTRRTGLTSSLVPDCFAIYWRFRSATSRPGASAIQSRIRELENIRNFLTSSDLTLAIDLFFTIVFIAALFFYSQLLTWIVLISLPIYVAISVGATPLFRRYLDDKFARGAENQAFLVESVTAVETLKSIGDRTANAAALGGAAGRLRGGEFPRSPVWATRPANPLSSSASW